jgi:sugar O-acyltransferase (sialic acid O-acetyltransferase NeuD family)
LIVGGGGHARSVIDIVEAASAFEIAGVLDDIRPAGSQFLGHPILGPLDAIESLASTGAFGHCFVAVGDNAERRRIVRYIRQCVPRLAHACLLHPTSVVSCDVSLGEGTVLMANASIGAGSRIGTGCIVNTSASVDHDCELEDFVSLAPGAHTGGRVFVGEGSAIGVGAAISNGVRIGAETVVGVGSAVVADIPGLVVAFGVPARTIRPRQVGEKYL